jgi:hypothetical protein
MKLSMMAIAAGAALLCASPARAQDEWTRQVSEQLDLVVEAMEERGFSPVGDAHTDALGEGASDEVELRLAVGSYEIVGMCDADCEDLDLLLGRDGVEIASDFETDDTPVLAFAVEEGGTFTLRVDMATCTSGPCRYGVRVFTGRD